MSTRDHLDYVNESYKKAYDSLGSGMYREVGHSYPLIAKYESGFARYYGSAYPRVGQILAINEEEQNFAENATVTVKYSGADFSGWTTGEIPGITGYEYKVYTTGTRTGEYTYTIYSGTRAKSQEVFGENVHEIYDVEVIEGSVSPEPKLQHINFYIIGDDGAAIINGFSSETERQRVHEIKESQFIHPQSCKLCSGDGSYQGSICPHCDGRGHIGYKASNKMMELVGYGFEEYRRFEDYQELQHRIWAKKQWIFPNKKQIKQYVADVAGIDSGTIDVTVENTKLECNFKIQFPYAAGGTAWDVSETFNVLIRDRETLQDMVSLVEPAGTNAIITPYYLLQDKSEMTYDNYSPTGSEITSLPMSNMYGNVWYKPFSAWKQSGIQWTSGWITSGYNTNDGTARFFNSETYYDINDPFLSGLTEAEATGMFYQDNMNYWTGEANTYITGESISGYVVPTGGWYT
jgi:hypothetical protein